MGAHVVLSFVSVPFAMFYFEAMETNLQQRLLEAAF